MNVTPEWLAAAPVPGAAATQRAEALAILIGDVDELLSYIAILKTPEVDAVRDALEVSLLEARRSLLQSEREGASDYPRPAKSALAGMLVVIAATAITGLFAVAATSARAWRRPTRGHPSRKPARARGPGRIK